MQRLATLATITALVLVILTAGSAAADDPWGDVNCGADSSAPGCDVQAVDPGHGGSITPVADKDPECHIGKYKVDCYSEGFGWFGGDGCYYGKDPGGFLPSDEWTKRCYNPATDEYTDEGIVLLFDPPAVLQTTLRQAVDRLGIPTPAIAASPRLTGPQIVQVPVWLWVPTANWRARTASASVAGFTITARATPSVLSIDPGDGTETIRCEGPGSPWKATAPARQASPSCGHTYTTTSRTEAGAKFTLEAAVVWKIDWAAPGMNGTEPDLIVRSTAAVGVSEQRSVVKN